VRIIFAGGGTGGHLYPGLAIARAIRRLSPDVVPFFIGALRGVERSVLPTTEFEYELLDLHPLYRSRPWLNALTLRGAASSWRRVAEIIRSSPPACIVGTGGYASGIALAYATVHKIPFAIQEQNSYPGLTTRFFSRFARQVHNGFPEAAQHLSPGRATQVFDSGNPIEPPPDPRPPRGPANRAWGFPEEAGPVMLIYGGSQGSKAINDVVAQWISKPLPAGLRIIWATGERTYDYYKSLQSESVRIRPYLSPIFDAYAAADFALSRGGAMATAELCAWGIPPIVVPLPSAAADHQTANARALSAAGAAELIPQRELTPARLGVAVGALAGNPLLLQERSRMTLQRARPFAAQTIATRILEMINLKHVRA
jgi:UDP-N-acetylglucosamine--N-acetylmuramyl-(pentapeptide) pyrophosphoryl-undecaprenol N-acetylglucosamine transferase